MCLELQQRHQTEMMEPTWLGTVAITSQDLSPTLYPKTTVLRRNQEPHRGSQAVKRRTKQIPRERQGWAGMWPHRDRGSGCNHQGPQMCSLAPHHWPVGLIIVSSGQALFYLSLCGWLSLLCNQMCPEYNILL